GAARSGSAAAHGSRASPPASSAASTCGITGGGSSGGAGLARTSATRFSRVGAPPGARVTPRAQPATARATRATVISRGRARSWICTAMSALLPFLHCRHFVLVEVAVGLHRAGQLERRVLADAGIAVASWLQRDVVHGHDDHARQRGHAADEAAELVVAADHAQ